MSKRQAALRAAAVYLPEEILGNDALAELYSGWSAERFESKTGIKERRVARVDEFTSDLAVSAANKLFAQGVVKREDIDFILLCTQTPDYFLPTTACLVQERLGIPTTAGALDFNLGCSGYVYGLGLAKGLVETGQANRVLFITADTFTRLVHPLDRSVRTIFGDGASATLIEAVEEDEVQIGPFVYGTDGSGAAHLIVPAGAMKEPRSPETAVEIQGDHGSIRSRESLYMNGRRVLNFGVDTVPKVIDDLCAKAGKTKDDFDLFLLHQANEYMLRQLQVACDIPEERMPIAMQWCGNTVSSTIPLALCSCLENGSLKPGMNLMMVGFGVGLSWGAVQVRWKG
jgi:3-oxoacyl-[acyl-carrier-protein] synthase III